jgi:alkaline phosphatase
MLKRTRGYSIGVVTTADFSDATSAAAFAHGRDRADANRNAYVVQALEFGVDVLMGGGARRLIPQSVEGSRRTDDRDLFAEFEAAGYTVVTTNTELSTAVEGDAPARILGVFHPNDMNVWLDRNVYTENLGEFTDQPGLSAMTIGALEVLSTNENGFYLTVEAASVDKQLHPLDQERALSDLIEFDQTIGDTIAWLEANGLAENTLIVVTADHGHGYEVYGTVNTEVFDAGTTDLERRRAIRVYNAAGYPDYPDADGDGQPEWADATIVLAGNVNNGPEHTEDFRVSPVPRVPAINQDGVFVDNPDDDPNGILITGTLDPASSTGVHTLQDVPVFAMGPGAEAFLGMYHQSEIFFGMASALGLNPAVESAE